MRPDLPPAPGNSPSGLLGRLRAVARFATAIFVPTRCLGCGSARETHPQAHALCASCLATLLSSPHVAGAVCVDSGPAAALVRRGKHGHTRLAARTMCDVTLLRVDDYLQTNAIADRHGPFDGVAAVTWVPAAPSRAARRGYHLPELYAHELARRLDLPVCGLLRRVDETPQRGGSLAWRLNNVADSFRPYETDHDLPPGAILLVDDVRTTGATLATASSVLGRHHDRAVETLAFTSVPRRFERGLGQSLPRAAELLRKEPFSRPLFGAHSAR